MRNVKHDIVFVVDVIVVAVVVIVVAAVVVVVVVVSVAALFFLSQFTSLRRPLVIPLNNHLSQRKFPPSSSRCF